MPAFDREYVADLLSLPIDELPDYNNLNLPVAEHFCAEEQVTFPHAVLLAGSEGMETIVDAVQKIKTHASELLSEA
jgi:hypothetical protein